jgi:hypothetical protein
MKTMRALRQREGSVLAIVAVMLVALLAIISLAVDLGMAYTARAEAQRVADAGALAGASAFLDWVDPPDAVPDAYNRAYDYVARNVVRNEHIDPDQDVNVEVVVPEEIVRVWVQRRGLGTWFARFLGVDELTVNAAAVAQALNAGAATCLKPWALMDLWYEADSDTNGNRWWDQDENWEFDPTAGDDYQKTAVIGENDAGVTSEATGYGSGFRNNPFSNVKDDWGRQIHIKAPDPNSEYVPNPGTFLPWRIGEDDAGADDYRTNIRECNPTTVHLTDEDSETTHDAYPIETGNMVGPTFQGVRDLIAQDPGAHWVESVDAEGNLTGEVVGSTYPDGTPRANWMDSPRVIKVAMIDPLQIVGSGMQEIEFNNFALLFLENQPTMHDDVIARFLFYVDGSGGHTGAVTSPLAKTIRLIG